MVSVRSLRLQSGSAPFSLCSVSYVFNGLNAFATVKACEVTVKLSFLSLRYRAALESRAWYICESCRLRYCQSEDRLMDRVVVMDCRSSSEDARKSCCRDDDSFMGV